MACSCPSFALGRFKNKKNRRWGHPNIESTDSLVPLYMQICGTSTVGHIFRVLISMAVLTGCTGYTTSPAYQGGGRQPGSFKVQPVCVSQCVLMILHPLSLLLWDG